MKLIVNRDAMLEALAKVQSVVSTKTTIPVLSNVLFTAEKGRLLLSSTDLEVSVQTEVAADVSKTGSTTLPAKRIFSVIRELPPHDLELEVDDNHVASISCGNAFFKIVGLGPDDFPPIPEPDSEQAFTLDQGALRQMLKTVHYAASNDETRYVLNGVLFSFIDQKLTLVATDGRRLALTETELEYPEDAEQELVVPSKTIHELIRNLDGEGELRLAAAGNQAVFDLGGMQIITKLIDGTFPNYRQVVPAACEERVALDRESLLAAVRRVALVTNEQSNSVKLSFLENALEIVTVTPDVGEAREQLPIKYSGKEVTIAFNPEFMMAPLKVLESDEVFLELTDELSPGVLKSDISFLYVIMPMRLQ